MPEPKIFFLCDGKACPAGCAIGCLHTSSPAHAKNFRFESGCYIEHPAPAYDFEFAESLEELQRILRRINQNGYQLVSVTQDDGAYSVFFGRPR